MKSNKSESLSMVTNIEINRPSQHFRKAQAHAVGKSRQRLKLWDAKHHSYSFHRYDYINDMHMMQVQSVMVT